MFDQIVEFVFALAAFIGMVVCIFLVICIVLTALIFFVL